MNSSESAVALRAAVYAAYSLAPAETAAKLTERLRTETLQALGTMYVRPSQAALAAVLASGDRDLLAAVAGHDHVDEDAALDLALLGDPAVAYALLTARGRSERTRDAVWRAADPASPGWRTDVVEPFLAEATLWQVRSALRSALRAPFPEVVRLAVGTLAPLLPPWVIVDGALRIVALTDPADVCGELDALAAVLRESADEHGHTDLADVVDAAARSGDPAAVLRAARAERGGGPEPRPAHDAWLVGLRFGDESETPPGGVDWEAVRGEAARSPFTARAKVELTRHEGCPPDVVAEAVRDGIRTDSARRLGPVPMSAAIPPGDPGDLAALLSHGLDAGWYGIEEALDCPGPAGEVLHALHRLAPRRADGADEGGVFHGSGAYRGRLPDAFAPAVARFVAPLGDDPEAWVSLYKLVGRFRGSCRELVAAAVEHAAEQRAGGTPVAWPKHLDAKFPAEAPEGARRQLYIMLAAAPEQVQRAVIPALDARAIQHLTVYYPLSAAVRTHIYDVCGVRAAVANAAHWEMPAEVVEGLLDLDDPDVNAYLYDFGAIAQDERVRICAGRRRDGGTDEVAISPALVDLLARTSPSRRRTWLLAALDSGDPALVRAMLGRTRLSTDAGRLRVAIGLWERHGPDAVAALLDETEYPGRRPGAKHPFPATTHAVLRAAIAASDAGLASLHAALAAARAPEEVARYVIGRGAKAAERLDHFDAEYGMALPWRVLVAADAASPLPAPVLEALIERKDCPRELLRAYLARNRVQVYRVTGLEWLDTALADGRLHTEDLLALVTPAAALVEHLTEAVTAGRLSPRADILAVMAAAGFSPADPDHWAVALRLLPDFPGALPELLATTVAITS
ncbi:hypothetical protein ACPA54_35340 [Uniformispora flossi]|uniref:hypothetical protein n=1 Tax=Uniformispora flossi TaxID=3390723 RepID=UPI003C2DF7E0